MSTGRPRNSDRSSRCHRAGLTLIELMVVMALMVLLAGVTAPSMVAAHREGRIRAATRQVLARLRYARSRAVTSGTTVRFNVRQSDAAADAPSQTWISVLTTESTSGESRFEEETTPSGRPRSLPEGIHIELSKAPSDQSTFSEPTAQDEEGVAYLTFWRNGETVDALLTVTDDRGGARFVRVKGMTGRATLVDEDDLTDEELKWEHEQP